MLQLAPIILIAVLLARDEGYVLAWSGAEWGWPWTVAAAALPVALILGAAHGLVLWCDRRVVQSRTVAPLRKAERLIRSARWLIIIHFAVTVLVFDWLGLVRSVTGNIVLVDELVALAPALLGLAGSWWVYYPIEQRVQAALLIRRLDEGQPVYPTLSRMAYTILQTRLHLFVMLIPLLMILGTAEAINGLANRFGGEWTTTLTTVSTLVAGIMVFIIAPPVICALLDVKRLPAGTLRDALSALAQKHKVRLRAILVWNTSGTMINAAVLGLVGWFRYVLITDALLDVMSRRQLLAVMAHEVGHVKRHHMPWLAGSLIASLFVATHVVGAPLYLMTDAQIETLQSFDGALELVLVGGSLALALIMFGWVCRRFERQADTFAVQHLSAVGVADSGEAEAPPPSERVTIESVEAMQSALQTIARLNAIDPKRPSWRHGSIAWRKEYLASLPGQMLSKLEIDRVIVRIKAMTAATLLVALAAFIVPMVTSRKPVGPMESYVMEAVKRPADADQKISAADVDE